MKTTPFSYVNAINSGDKGVLSKIGVKDYNAFIVNRQFSYFPDTISWANEMNIRHNLDADMQFAFLINIIRPRKRFAKWSKSDKSEQIAIVSEYYQCNYEKALTIVDVLSDDNINEIKKKLEKGGIKK